MPKPWTSLSLRRSNTGPILTNAQVNKLRKDGDINTLGQLVSDRGKKAMADLFGWNDKKIQEVVDKVTPDSAKQPIAQDKSAKDEEDKKKMPPPPPPKKKEPEKPAEETKDEKEEKKDTPDKPDEESEKKSLQKTSETAAPKEDGPPKKKEVQAAPAKAAEPSQPTVPAKDVEFRRPESRDIRGTADMQDMNAVPEAAVITNIQSDKEVANGSGPADEGKGRILPAASIGPAMQQAALATTDSGEQDQRIASEFNPVTGSDNVLPQNRDGDEGRLALGSTSRDDTGRVFGVSGAPSKVTKPSGRAGLPAKIQVSQITDEQKAAQAAAMRGGSSGPSAQSIADAVKQAIKPLVSSSDDPSDIKMSEEINELRAFLPIAGANDVMPPKGSDELKKENLALAFDYRPSGWPVDDGLTNPLALNNRIDLGVRWSGQLYPLPSIHPGGSLTQGARVYESYPDYTAKDMALERSKRKVGSMESEKQAMGPAKRARMDPSWALYNAATQAINDGVYESPLDSNPAVSVLREEIGRDNGMDFRLEVYPAPAQDARATPGSFKVPNTGGIPTNLMLRDDYNPTVSRPGVFQRVLV